jgi:hypothetical protein
LKALALAACGLAIGLSPVRAEVPTGGARPPNALSTTPDSATLALFLPPVPPALGAPIVRPAATSSIPASGAAPLELRPYLRDPFYVALGAQFKHHEIGSDLAYSLEWYLTTKAALQTELRARLDLVRELTPAARAAELRRFAAEQTPRIDELEATAESLRNSIAHRSAAQRELIRWKIDSMAPAGVTTPPRGFDLREFMAQTALMIATFTDGPNADQRRWLHELADERRNPSLSKSTWAFLPQGSRINLAASDPVSPQLQQLLHDYFFLHGQLLTSVIKVMSVPGRFEAAPWLAAAPAQGLLAAQLEAKAEAIRELLVQFKDPALLPQSPAVPPVLEPQLARYRAAKTALQQQVLQRVEAAKQAGPSDSAPARIRQAVAEFTTEHQAEYAELDRSRQQLLDQLTALAVGTPGSPPSSPDALASTFNQSLTQLKSFWEYRDYQNAVIQPGLSAEQRRLLFESALIKLDLPLPGALRPVQEE